MKKPIIAIIALASVVLIVGCSQSPTPSASDFRIAQDYFEFASKMENGDTLNIEADLSMCLSGGYDQIQITRSNDSVFLQLIESRVMDDAPIHLHKVLYNLRPDTLSLEKLLADLDVSDPDALSNPFFMITNPKEKDTILLRTTGLTDLGLHLQRYESIMLELYPEELGALRNRYELPPPDSIKIEVMEFLAPES